MDNIALLDLLSMPMVSQGAPNPYINVVVPTAPGGYVDSVPWWYWRMDGTVTWETWLFFSLGIIQGGVLNSIGIIDKCLGSLATILDTAFYFTIYVVRYFQEDNQWLIINIIFYGFKLPTSIGLIDCEDLLGFNIGQYFNLLLEGIGFVKKDSTSTAD